MLFEGGDVLKGEIGVGLLACLINIAIHAVIMAVLTWIAHHTTLATQASGARMRLVLVMWATVTVLMFAHLMEIGTWALTYVAVGTVEQPGDSFYFAFVNYTTLGYGDVLPVKRWRLLGPMAAMNGVLLFGWSTAVIYDILRTIAQVIPLKPTEKGA